MTKKADMSSRYAAAHARREQRRRETPSREYLPLAEERAPSDVANTPGIGPRFRGTAATSSSLASRLPRIDYGYLRGDLTRTAVLCSVLFAAMIALSFIIK